MGTRSDIIVHRTDDTWARAYCHWDGYLEHNGRILFDHYTSQSQAEELVSLGDMSTLAERCDKPEGHTFENPTKGHTIYYGRDRGEQGTEATIGETLAAVWPEADTWTEFTYVWDDGQWWVGDPDEGSQTLINLGDALLGKKTLKPAVKAFGAVIGQHNGANVRSGHSWTRR